MARKHPRSIGPNRLEDEADNPQTRIQWPSEHEITEVSRTLKTVKNMGIKYEDSGDYFTSGDLAYQMHEIIRNATELLHKSQRMTKRLA
jgi:hypothetical protein